MVDEDLRLVFQQPERPAMDDAVAVPLEVVAPLRRRLVVHAPARALRVAGVGGERLHGQLRQSAETVRSSTGRKASGSTSRHSDSPMRGMSTNLRVDRKST